MNQGQDLEQYCQLNPDDPICRQARQAKQMRQPQQSGPPPGAGQVAGQFMGGGESAAGGAGSYVAPAAAMAAFMKWSKDQGLMDTNMEVLGDMGDLPKDMGNRTKDLAAKMKFWEWF